MSTAAVPKTPSAAPGLPEPLQRLEAVGADKGSAQDYPICWSSDGSADRTKEPILEAIQPLLDASKAAAASAGRRASVLELASGLGEHIRHFAEPNPDVDFQPTECDPHLVERVSQACQGRDNIRAALVLNALESTDWDGVRAHLAGGSFDGVIMQNLLHIAPSDVTSAMFRYLSPRAAAPILSPTSGWISIYGTFIDDGVHLSEGDKKFDDHIRGLSPLLGLRDISRFVVPEAEEWGFELQVKIPMPRGNWLLVFRPRS